ncbi:MAG: glycosyltransferase, partial [Selenomonas sp.]|nr:glycosyltransferase [Selenomonas sp.]
LYFERRVMRHFIFQGSKVVNCCSVDLYPLVSVIIPTYQRPDYFRQALASAAGQMYRNLDIFVTDNSHNEETKRVYEKCFADDSRIRYEHHPEYDMWGNWYPKHLRRFCRKFIFARKKSTIMSFIKQIILC